MKVDGIFASMEVDASRWKRLYFHGRLLWKQIEAAIEVHGNFRESRRRNSHLFLWKLLSTSTSTYFHQRPWKLPWR